MKRIEINPNVMVGKRVIKETRIPLNLIIKLLAQGMTRKEILEEYPNLKKEDIDKEVFDIKLSKLL